MITTDEKARCRCGHRLYDHLGPRGRCNEGTKRCRCGAFTLSQEEGTR